LTAPSITCPFQLILHCGSSSRETPPQFFAALTPQLLGTAETEQPQQNNLLLRAQLCANIQHAGPEGNGGEMCREYLTWELATTWNSEVEVLFTLM